MSEKITLEESAEKMAEAIREWNRAKQERESWVPVVGQVPPVGILGSAKKANALLAESLSEYEAFQQGFAADRLRSEAKLSERKTVHEWLNDVGIPREEFGKPICLLRRLRIAVDRLYEIGGR